MSNSSQPTPKKITRRRTFALIGLGLTSFIPAARLLLEKTSPAQANRSALYTPCTRVSCRSVKQAYCAKGAPKFACYDAYITSRFCCYSCCFDAAACVRCGSK